MASKRQQRIAWGNAKPIRGKNPNLWRRDKLGNQIYKPAYGTNGEQGWGSRSLQSQVKRWNQLTSESPSHAD